MLKSHEVPQRFFRMRNLPYLKVLAPPFRILQRVKSPPFHIPKASKRYPFRVEPPRIGHHMEYGTPPPPPFYPELPKFSVKWQAPPVSWPTFGTE